MNQDNTYDADGNRTSRTAISSSYSTDYKTTYTWDYRNRLTDVEDYDNNGVLTEHVHYVYDVFDHLSATEVDPTGGGTYTEIQHYVLDVSPEAPAAGVPGTATAQPVLVFDGNGNLIGRNLVALNAAGVDAIVAQGTVASLTQADTVNWDLTDNLGSLRIILNNTSSIIDEIVYNSVGQVAYESNSAVAHFAGFEGGHIDANTGLVNDYHRWYDPAIGKWLSEDPLTFAAGDEDLTRYVANDPVERADPTGLFPDPEPQQPPLVDWQAVVQQAANQAAWFAYIEQNKYAVAQQAVQQFIQATEQQSVAQILLAQAAAASKMLATFYFDCPGSLSVVSRTTPTTSCS